MAQKILLIDDDEAITTVFGTALKHEGFEVVCALDGKTGMEMAKSEQPNLILLDQILPDMKGNEILKMLKADEATKNTPIAILSNFGQNELIQEAMNAGAVEYILKYQIDPKDLGGKVKQILAQQNKS